MTDLIWRPITEVRLREALIPDPAGTGSLDTISVGRLALDQGVLYIDPRPDSGAEQQPAPYTVTAVPLAGVIAFSYEAEDRARVRPLGT